MSSPEMSGRLQASLSGAPSAAPTSRRGRARYLNALRTTTYLLILYTLGHTFGAVVSTPQFGPASDAVVSMMKSVHVTAQGADGTWYGYYRGFGVIVSVYFLFAAVLTWHLGGMTPRERRPFAPVTWALFVSYVATAVVTWVWFFPVPLVFSMAIAALLGFTCLRDERIAG
jgi:hypothetical protein